MRCPPTVTLPPSYRCPLSTDYRPLGSCSRAAGWSAATLCHGTKRILLVWRAMSAPGSLAVATLDGCHEPRLSWVGPRGNPRHVQHSKRETEMPMFITYASYSQSGAKGLIDKPADRSGAIKGLIEKAGGKLIALYFTTGSNDVVLISEVADGSDAVAVGMAVAASGSLSKIETVRAWTPSEFKSIAEKAAKVAGTYTPPGK